MFWGQWCYYVKGTLTRVIVLFKEKHVFFWLKVHCPLNKYCCANLVQIIIGFQNWIFAIIYYSKIYLYSYLLFTKLQTSFGEMQLARIPNSQSLKDFEKCKSSMDFNVIIEQMDCFIV